MPARAASVTTAPQTIASQPNSVDIRTSKALTIEIAKVPDGKTIDPHWTAYIQAIGTPIVAVIAAVIATTIQYRQWKTANAAAQTAKNKLKLDLFEKRFKQYEAANQLMLHGQEVGRPKRKEFMSDKIIELIGAEFIFSEDVNHFVQRECFVRLVKILEAEEKLANTNLPSTEADALRQRRIELTKWFEDNYPKLKEFMGPYLQLAH